MENTLLIDGPQPIVHMYNRPTTPRDRFAPPVQKILKGLLSPPEAPTERPVWEEIREMELQLDGLDLKLLNYLAWLCNKTAKMSPSGAHYCYVAEETMAKRFGVRRETVSLHICKLGGLGLIVILHRRKKHGHWQCNLYRLRDPRAWRLARIAGIKNHASNRVRLIAQIVLLKEETLSPKTQLPYHFAEKVGGVLEAWAKRGT